MEVVSALQLRIVGDILTIFGTKIKKKPSADDEQKTKNATTHFNGVILLDKIFCVPNIFHYATCSFMTTYP